ncbi:acyl-CoA dehydrogenase family protein [Pollutimonas bauzanensis]|jgi:alkylation response protein AidB-like acyl-CoA dehydrogenase|uniref:acyl-CoA dehydrogenase family protein n=1 Tax=Pollutimonas bauzanensis TaxID=658167 RepID=UPI0033413E6C
MDNLFSESVERLFSQVATPVAIRAIEQGASTNAMWQELEQSGYLDALVPEAQDGAGLTLAQVFPMLLSAGKHAVPLPFAQTMLARAWLTAAGVVPPSGAITIAGLEASLLQNGAIQADTVPFGWVSQWVLADLGDYAALLPVADADSEHAGGYGSLCATLRWNEWPATAVKIPLGSPLSLPDLAVLAAAALASLMAGAADRVLALTLDYANQRSQFGKHIGKFQAVQSQISVMAERTWACRMAAQLACQGKAWAPQLLLAAVGKSRCSEAAAIIADIGHAVHGAIGVTQEYDLQLYTRRLREWRLCGGGETYWASRIGAQLLHHSDKSALAFICDELSAGSQ